MKNYFYKIKSIIFKLPSNSPTKVCIYVYELKENIVIFIYFKPCSHIFINYFGINNNNNKNYLKKIEYPFAMEKQQPPEKAAEKMVRGQTGAIKRDIIDHYDNIQAQIDMRTETLLAGLPEALKKGRDELLERVREEKEKNLAALAEDSPLVRYKNEYYQRFLQLKQDYESCGNDEAKKEQIRKSLDQLRKDLELLDEFLDDFKNRTLCFEEADKSVYASLIGELVTYDDLKLNENLISKC